MALVQQKQASDDEDEELGAPAAAVYKTHSTSIFDVLGDMREKAEDQLDELRKAESTAKHNFNMLKQSLEDEMENDNKDMDEEKSLKAASEEQQATAEGDLAETVKELAKDRGALATAQSTCMSVAADHESTVKSRTEELTAIATARKILEETSAGAVGETYSLFQVGTGSKLRTRADLANAELVNLVKHLAKKYHSSSLAQLASRISVVMRYGDDVFAKVKGLIRELIDRLLAEAAAEASEKAYCDEQMAKTEAKKADLDADIAKLTSKIDTETARSNQLKAQVKELQGELAALAKLQAEMDKTRMDENAAYTKAKADLELGLGGVQKALSVLREYYGSAALVQQPAKPELHAKASGAGGGIIDILEVVESDFSKGLAAEETAEADAAATYEKMTQENKVTKTTKDQDVKYKSQEFTSTDKEISELSGDKDSANSELSAVLDYYGKIKDRCIAKPETYEG